MAKRLTPAQLCAIAFAAVSCASLAQALTDPTRPPTEPLPADAGGVPVDTSKPQLQSILISPNRRLAIIDGQTVALGGHFGDARLVSISETAVVLKRGDKTETLRLVPAAVDKTAVRQKAREAIKR